MWPHDRAETVVRVADARRPLAHGFGHGVLERGGTRVDGHDRRAEKAHAVDIQCLADGVLLAHENDALHALSLIHIEDDEEYDLLIGMEGANLKNMQRICGGDPAGKMHRLLDYTDRPGDVADPWYTGDFEATWRDVSEGCKCLLAEIEKSGI